MQDMIHPVNILLTYEQHNIEQGPGVQPVLNELVDNSHNLQVNRIMKSNFIKLIMLLRFI